MMDIRNESCFFIGPFLSAGSQDKSDDEQHKQESVDTAHESDGHGHSGEVFQGHGDEEQQDIGNTFNVAYDTERF